MMSGMHARRPPGGLAWGALQSDRSDLTVMQAIENVIGEQRAEDSRTFSTRERTQAIYNEIKRLDLARISESVAPVKGEEVIPPTSDGMTG
jgi:hypothetical protein